MDTVIKVENLSKKYLIGHQRQGSYLTLRDTIAQKARGWGKRLAHPFRASSGQPLGDLSTTEEFWALRDVYFEIKQGDRVGIIGRNGAGKSTLLKLLSRITEPTSGRITLNGRVASLLEVGTGFHPELTGRENIYLNGAVLGMTRAEIKRKFDEIVAFAEVEKFLDTPVKLYSSGMYVRLAFAVAAHLEPEILIVDEVLAVGDAQFQKKCLGKMEEVGKEGRTVLFVSHNMAAISALCDKSILLHKGSLTAFLNTHAVVGLYLKSNKRKSKLTERMDRPGNGVARFTEVCILNDKDEIEDPLISGNNYSIELTLASKHDLKNISFKISAYNSVGQIITQFFSDIYSNLHSARKGVNKIRCNIKRFPLSNGNYTLNFSAVANGELLDHVSDGFHFTVENGDFFGTGRTIADLREICLFDQNWELI